MGLHMADDKGMTGGWPKCRDSGTIALVNRESALELVSAHLREAFGQFLVARDARTVRRAVGNTWAVSVVVPAKTGDVPVGDIEVDEDGTLRPLAIDDVLLALKKTEPSITDLHPSLPPAGDFGLEDEESEDWGELGKDDGSDDPEAIRARAQALMMKGDPDSLRKARDLMPRLLGDPDRRGLTLLRLAEIEKRLDAKNLANGYLEAAAREFADRFDMPSLEKAAAMSLEMQGADAFATSEVHGLLERCRARLRPLDSMFQAPALQAVHPMLHALVAGLSTTRTLKPGETLVTEGEPSRAVFIIKSGLIGVLLEREEGGARLVRCCFPGWLLGESSVLIDSDPRCSATLRAQRVSEVWRIDAAGLREVMRENPELAERIASTKQIHRIDSFFSMHETMGQLDVQVRDRMIGCIASIQSFDEDTILLKAGAVPEMALLVARGEVALYAGDDYTVPPVATLGADRFYGVRDAIHQIPIEVNAVALPGATVAFFDAERLRALVESSGDQVAVVLERLG